MSPLTSGSLSSPPFTSTSLTSAQSPPLLTSLTSAFLSFPPLTSYQEASMGQLEEAFYDHFNLELTRVQVIIAAAGLCVCYSTWLSTTAL